MGRHTNVLTGQVEEAQERDQGDTIVRAVVPVLSSRVELLNDKETF